MAWLFDAGNAQKTLTIAGREVIQGDLIADGGFAYVYRGRDAKNGEELAIRKAFLQDAEAIQAAKIELHLLKRLTPHPNVVHFFGGEILQATVDGSSKMQAISILELCTGGMLLSRLEAEMATRATSVSGLSFPCCCPCLSEAEALAVLGGISAALAHLHRACIIHYDVKSENLLLGQDGLWKLADFGSASERTFHLDGAPRKQVLEAEEFVHGRCTPIYRAPEVADVYLKWTIGPAVDVFALGCVAYAVLTGVHPFPLDSALGNIQARYHIPGQAEKSYSKPLLHWLRQLLNREPEARPTAAALAEEVQCFVTTGQLPSMETANLTSQAPSTTPRMSLILDAPDWVADFSNLPPPKAEEPKQRLPELQQGPPEPAIVGEPKHRSLEAHHDTPAAASLAVQPTSPGSKRPDSEVYDEQDCQTFMVQPQVRLEVSAGQQDVEQIVVQQNQVAEAMAVANQPSEAEQPANGSGLQHSVEQRPMELVIREKRHEPVTEPGVTVEQKPAGAPEHVSEDIASSEQMPCPKPVAPTVGADAAYRTAEIDTATPRPPVQDDAALQPSRRRRMALPCFCAKVRVRD